MHRNEQDLHAEFSNMDNPLSLFDTHPVARVVIDDYTKAQADLIYLAYVHFLNTSVQQPVIEKLLPVEPPESSFGNEKEEYIWEPDAATVLGGLLPRYVEMQVYHAILELIASEHSARMVAMRNASDNATEMINDLTLTMNRKRQETITNELCDITRLT